MSDVVSSTIQTRAVTHGDWEKQGAFAARLKLALRDAPRTKGIAYHQWEALDMICTKISRILHGDNNEPDHWKDIAGYAMLVHKAISVPKDGSHT